MDEDEEAGDDDDDDDDEEEVESWCNSLANLMLCGLTLNWQLVGTEPTCRVRSSRARERPT
jgi:hypothetical protein